MPERIVELATGTLVLECDDLDRLEELCDFAARANPKRGFLIVSKVLGRHLPVRPKDFFASTAELAAMLPHDLPKPAVFLGMAETATALAQATWEAWCALNSDGEPFYLQTSRQRAEGSEVVAQFEEGHSHATSHMIQIADPAMIEELARARSLVIIDDECSTGNTFLNAASAMAKVMPALEEVHCASLTDWSGGEFLEQMPAASASYALLEGSMRWTPSPKQFEAVLASKANRHGTVPSDAMPSRIGTRGLAMANRPPMDAKPGERVLVLGDAEHSHEAALIADEIEKVGGIAAFQSITRTPALLGHAMQSVTLLEDSYGSGATCHLYNILAHQPDRIVVAAELVGNQVRDLENWLREAGVNIPVELVHCRYGIEP